MNDALITSGAYGAVRFPVVSAQGVELETVQCILSPRERAKKSFVIHGPDPAAVERTLGEARSAEQHENSAFSVNVRFVPNRFADSSYSLALAIADKWARGCWPELPERALVMATGLIEQGGAGVVGAVGHFVEKLTYIAATAPRGTWLVVPRLNMECLPQEERQYLERQLDAAGIRLLSIQHLNELNALWQTSNTPPVGDESQRPPLRRRYFSALLVICLFGLATGAGVWGWSNYTQTAPSTYRLTGGSADRLWCASATLPEYLATWQLSDQQPPCLPKTDRSRVLVELLAQAQSESGFVVDQSLYNRYHALDTAWLAQLKQQAPSPALELLSAFESRLGQVEHVRRQAMALHGLALQLEQHNRYRDAQRMLQTLTVLDDEVRNWFSSSDVDIQALESDARQRIRQIEIQRVAVEYYWEKLQAGDLDVSTKLQGAAVALGRDNWGLLAEDIRHYVEKF